MFGPNSHVKTKINIKYSHRDNEFIELYKTVQNKFKKKFNLENYEIVFIPGSGTVGMESVIFSLKGTINVIGFAGEFKRRWNDIVNTHNKIGTDNFLYCKLETSNSQFVSWNESGIVDCISSFPFYDIPPSADIFVTCTNKQLGSLSGLSIVGIKKDFIKNLKESNSVSYLNLKRYLDFNSIYQTPTTTPTYIFEHFNKILNNFNIKKLRKKIINNSQRIVKCIDDKYIIGELECPVITIDKRGIDQKIAEKWQLYGINKKSKYYQIFTYSCKDKYYKKLCKDLRK